MRLALVDSVPLTYAGGYESFLFALARAACARGHETRIITPTHALATAMGRPAGVRVQKRLSEEETRRRAAPAAIVSAGLRKSRTNVAEVDLVYTKNEPHELLFSLGASGDKPVVVGFHSAIQGRPGLSGKARAMIYRSGFYRSLLRRARAFHVLMPYQRDLLVTIGGIDQSRLRVIPNGIDLDRFDCRPAKPSGPTFEVLFVGRLDFQKGIDLFLEAAAELHEELGEAITFSVAGDGPFRKRVEKAAMRGIVRYLDHVVDPAPTYRQHDIVVAPSRWETFGLVPAESLACGLPVLVSAIPAFETFALCKAVLAVNPPTPRTLAAAITERFVIWRNDPRRYGRMRVEARDFARKNLDQRQRLDELITLFESLMPRS